MNNYESFGLRQRHPEVSSPEEAQRPESPSILSYGKLEGRRAVNLGVAAAIGCCISLLVIDVALAISDGGLSLDRAVRWIPGDLILSAEAGLLTAVTYGISTTSTAVSALVMKALTYCCGPRISRETAHKAIVAMALTCTAGITSFFERAVFTAFVPNNEALALTALSFALAGVAYQKLNRQPTRVAEEAQDIP